MKPETQNLRKIPALQASPSTITSATTMLRAISSLPQSQRNDDDTCLLPPDAGTCRDYIPRWFHNSQTGKCEQFSYGSCGGNSNNFPERRSCEAKCSRGITVCLISIPALSNCFRKQNFHSD